MFRNYFKIAWRNLWKHKTLSAIIVFGMAVAIAAALLLSLTAYHELSFDNFHTNKSHLYQVYLEQHQLNETEKSSIMPVPLAPALKAEYPDIVEITRMGSGANGLVRYNNRELDLNSRAVDPGFLKMFSFPILYGNNQDPLKDLNDIVITEQCAKKVFNTVNVTGRTLEMKVGNEWKVFRVTAIAKDFPDNSSFTFDVLTRFENFGGYQQNTAEWENMNHEVFIQLNEHATQAAFEKRVPKFSHTHFRNLLDNLKRDGAKPDADGELLRLRLIPFPEVHFNNISNQGRGVDKFYLYILLSISAFIIFIASVNFVNLSLARSFTRAKEIGIRKVMGAVRWQLISQFWGEALIVCLLALVVGCGLAYILLPYYKTTFYPYLSIHILQSPMVWAYLAGGFLLITLFAGGYPAWAISAFNTILIVKGKLPKGKSHHLRNSLMVVQFILSSFLIICTFVAWQQITYLRKKPLGYNKHQVVSIPINNNLDPEKTLALMRSKLANEPQVVGVTATDINLGRGMDGSSRTSMIGFDYNGRGIKTHWLRVDFDYLKTLDIKLLKGRDFSNSYGMDSAGVLINETMAQQLGEKEPVGKFLELDGSKLQVLGVVKDFNFKSLHQAIAPLTMFIRPDNWPANYIFVRVQPNNLPASMSMLQSKWKEINPQGAFVASFLDENTDRQYKNETRLSQIFMSSAILTILISCMGLFAIVLLVIVQRNKEISIRKVLGASVPSIVGLVSKDFLKLVLVAVLIASPLAWMGMNKWLESFAYRIHVSWWVLVLAGVTALLIAFITMSFQSVKAALRNPVDNLRSE
jgi:putative ABC transport system permease protein